MEWQNSQVVWMALDQRKVTGAPQLGQLDAGALHAQQQIARQNVVVLVVVGDEDS